MFKGASAGNFMGKGGLSRMFKGASAGNFVGKGGREGVAFAWDLARPPGTPASRSRGFLHGRMCCLAVVLSAGWLRNSRQHNRLAGKEPRKIFPVVLCHGLCPCLTKRAQKSPND